MGIFSKKSEAREIKTGTTEKSGQGIELKILGSGCAKCNALEAAVREAVSQLGMDAQIEHISDPAQIAAYGVMSTPALVAGGRVLCSGRALKAAEAAKLLKNAISQ